MHIRKISEAIYALHADIENARFFEGFWPIPQGVTLNSYLVCGQKIALIDLFRDWEAAPQKFADQLAELDLTLRNIDFLILNHLEPDHTGFLREFTRLNKSAQIITTEKGASLVKNFCKVDTNNLRIVKTGDELDLGGINLTFTEIPNVHWPETMVTYEPKSKTLFSCDAFGGYGKTGNRIFDDEFTTEEHAFFQRESLNYYANIVAGFSMFVKKAFEKLTPLDIRVIAPSHGIIWRTHPEIILQRYKEFAGYNTGDIIKKEICIICGSMYGNTKRGVNAILEEFKEKIPYSYYEIPASDTSAVLGAAYCASGLVIAMPTYEYKMYPPMAQIIDLFRRKRFTNKHVLRIGSWGWSGGAQKDYDAAIETLNWKTIESYEWQGTPTDNDYNILKQRGKLLLDAVNSD